MKSKTLELTPIGIIRTPFRDRADAPRQPRAELLLGEGKIVLNPGHNFEQALEDLDGFDYIWVVSWFHKNENWKPKVLPPRGSTSKRGVFATRSPYRPNPIGLSVARLVSVKARTIRVAETDLLDGTPILDIKPYLPYAESFPDARAGWLDAWTEVDDTRYTVSWSDLALTQSAWLREHCSIDLHAHAERALSRDAAPHPYRRISLNKSGVLQLAVKSWRIEFAVTDTRVEIQRLASGYSAEALSAKQLKSPLHDESAHHAFHAKWRPGE
ncbi:MAG: tRNA (N6-threonylcarbamoyladenosine(37)-N6)-methyltransferase TrmO [Planctomycetota bacterium]